MKCKQIHDRIARGDSLELSSVQEHLSGCSGCRALADVAAGENLDPLGLRELEEGDAVSLDVALLTESVLEAVGRERGLRAGLRNLSTLSRLTLGLGGFLLFLALTFVFGCRADWGVYPGDRMLLELASLSGIYLVALWFFIQPLHVALPRKSAVWAVISLAIVFPFFLGFLPQAHGDHPASLFGAGADFLPRAAACLGWGLAVSAPLLGLVVMLDRLVQRQGERNWLAAVAAAGVAVIGLQIKCPITYPGHILAGHAPVVVLVGILFWTIVWWVRRSLR